MVKGSKRVNLAFISLHDRYMSNLQILVKWKIRYVGTSYTKEAKLAYSGCVRQMEGYIPITQKFPVTQEYNYSIMQNVYEQTLRAILKKKGYKIKDWAQ